MAGLMIPESLLSAAQALIQEAEERGRMVATAESCTGGMITATLTAVAGSSAVVDRGFVTYSNASKAAMLGVPEAVLEAYGAVSAPVAAAMAEGALTRSDAHCAVAVTGIAGPGGGADDKPVGLVHFAVVGQQDFLMAAHEVFPGDRHAVRVATVRKALAMLMTAVQS